MVQSTGTTVDENRWHKGSKLGASDPKAEDGGIVAVVFAKLMLSFDKHDPELFDSSTLLLPLCRLLLDAGRF